MFQFTKETRNTVGIQKPETLKNQSVLGGLTKVALSPLLSFSNRYLIFLTARKVMSHPTVIAAQEVQKINFILLAVTLQPDLETVEREPKVVLQRG